MVPLQSLFGEDATVLRETDFQLLMLASLLPVLGTAVVSPVLDSLIGPFGTSAANISLMISVFTAPAIAAIPLAGALADRVGRKPLLVGSLVLFGLGGTAIAFTTDYRVVLALRLLQGVGFGGLNPIIITSIGDLYEGGTEATGQGFRFMVSGLSGTVFPAIAGVLVVIAWFYPFLLYAIAFPIAGMVYLWFDEPTASATPVSADGGDGTSYVRTLLRLLRHRRVLAMVVARTLMAGVWIGFMTYNSLIVVRLMGGTPPQAGLLAAVFNLLMGITASQAGRITAVFERRLYPLVGANVSLGIGFTTVLFAPGIAVATVGIALSGVGMGVTGSLYRSIITEISPERYRAGLVSLGEMGGRLMNTLTPIAMGVVIALASPVVGFASALRLAGVGVAVLVSGGGIVCIAVAALSPPVPTPTGGDG